MIGNIEDVMMYVTGESWMAKDTGSCVAFSCPFRAIRVLDYGG